MKIPFLNLKQLNKPFEETFKKRFQGFLDSGYYILGDSVKQFENEYADYCHTNFCVGTGNGLDAIKLILRAYIELKRLHEGDKVIVAANTYIATILAIKQAGLIPVLAEPDNETFNIDPKEVRQKITIKTKAVLATNLYGQNADLKTLSNLTTKENMLLIVDAAQSHGAVLENDNFNYADATAYSFYPTKNLGALGDAGAVTTDDKNLAETIAKIRNYGFSERYISQYVGYNSRLDELQAAFLSEKLKSLDTENEKRQKIARRYLNEINNEKIKLPYYKGDNSHVFHLFVVRVENRTSFCSYLENHEIGYNIHYPVPPHQQEALSELAELNFPITEKMSQEVVSIPLNPSLSSAEIDQIIRVLNQY